MPIGHKGLSENPPPNAFHVSEGLWSLDLGGVMSPHNGVPGGPHTLNVGTL